MSNWSFWPHWSWTMVKFFGLPFLFFWFPPKNHLNKHLYFFVVPEKWQWSAMIKIVKATQLIYQSFKFTVLVLYLRNTLKVHNQLEINLGLLSGRSRSTVCHARQLGSLSLVDQYQFSKDWFMCGWTIMMEILNHIVII